jgi:HD-like signal output (HDOD) protein
MIELLQETESKPIESFINLDQNRNDPFQEKLLQTLSQKQDLPAFPASIRKIQELLNKTASTDQIAEIVQQDVGMTARLISLANSAAFCGGTEIESIQDALNRIGLSELRKYILTSGVITEFSKLNIQVNWNKFWSHSLLTARLSERIADIFYPLTGSEFLIGLLHDVGKLLMQRFFPTEFSLIIEKSLSENKRMFDVENELFGINHAQIGGYLGSNWGLSEKIYNPILYHHEPHKAGDYSFHTKCVYIANLLATGCDENIIKNRSVADLNDINDIPCWSELSELKPRRTPYIPLVADLINVRSTVANLLF